MSNFIEDFMTYNGGTECHRNYLRWAAISAICAAAGPRYRLLNGTYFIYPIMYIMLVGAQGNRKTYAMSQVKQLIDEAFPDYPIGADITSRDDMIRFLASDVTERAYKPSDSINGEMSTYHPLLLCISEFKDFTSYNPAMMINFIVNIYDYVDRLFKCSTIKRGAEDIQGPFLSIIACENTDWFLRRLKEGVVTGGFSRRFNVVYEWNKPDKPVPRIILPSNHEEIHKRMVAHLANLHTNARTYSWTAEGQRAFDKWYTKNFHERQDDSSIAGFMSTKDQQLLKLCIALDLAESQPRYKISEDLIVEALAWFQTIEPNLKKLYLSGGRNELAAEWVKLIDFIDANGGIVAEKELLRKLGKDMSPRELQDSLKHLVDSEQLLKKLLKWPDERSILKTWLITMEGLKDEKIQKVVLASKI